MRVPAGNDERHGKGEPPLSEGRRLRSFATYGEGLVGAWWLDRLVGLFIAVVAVAEGREAWRGDTCCAH